MMLRRCTGILALLALLATPAWAQSRVVCRYTGEPIADCGEQCPWAPVVLDVGCCEQRAVRALPASNVASQRPLAAVATAPAVVPQGRRAADLSPLPAATLDRPPGRGPPIFIATRALLI